MVRAGMVRLSLHDGLEHGDDFLRVLTGLGLFGPVVPGIEVHHRVGVEGGRVEIVGKASAEFAHGFGEGEVESGPVGVFGGAVAGGERVDVGPSLSLACSARACASARAASAIVLASGLMGRLMFGP